MIEIDDKPDCDNGAISCEKLRLYYSTHPDEARRINMIPSGALPEPPSQTTPSAQVFAMSAGGKNYPNRIRYRDQLVGTLNQGSYGTCYMCATLHMAEYFIWRYSGKKVKFDNNDLMDCASDYYYRSYDYRKKYTSKGKTLEISGGWLAASTVYNFNNRLADHYFTQKKHSEKFKLFKDAMDAMAGRCPDELTLSIKTNTSTETIKNYVISGLTKYGPGYFSFYTPIAWGVGSGLHAITITDYDAAGMYCLNSWGKSRQYTRWQWNIINLSANSIKFLDLKFKNLG